MDVKEEEKESENQSLDAVLNPNDQRYVSVMPADVQLVLIKEEAPGEWRSGVDHQGPEALNIKEEEEELCISLDEEQLNVKEETDATRFPLPAVPLKSEDDEEKPVMSQLPQHQVVPASSSTDQMTAATGGEDCGGAETIRSPGTRNTQEEDSSSSQTEVSEDDEEEDNVAMQHVDNESEWSETEDSHDKRKEIRFPESGVGAVNTSREVQTTQRRYGCDFCGQRFIQKEHLEVHTRVHTGEKSFSCDDFRHKSSDQKNYRVLKEIPESSEDDDGGSDDEGLEKEGLVFSSSSDDEDDEGPENAENLEGPMSEDFNFFPPDRAQGQKRRNIWKMGDNKFQGDLPPFLGTGGVNVKGTEPLDFFMHLFPADLINEIVANTNQYAQQKGKENLAVTTEEMKTFLGVNMAMSYLKYPRSRMYWSSEEGLRIDLIANAMTVNRFEQVLRHIHFVDNSAQVPGNTDKLYKIRPVLDALEKTFRSAARPEEFQSVAEQIIPLKGLMSIKQYIPPKTKPRGLKMWVRAGTSGYMYRFEVYQGSAARGRVSKLGLAADVAIRLCDDIQEKNHKVFFDYFFCTIPLIQALQQQGIYGTGTCRPYRLQGAQTKLKSEKQLKTEGRGACSVVSNADNVTVTRWLDNSVIHLVSSCAGKCPSDFSRRWSKKEKKILHVERPFSVQLYNQHMGGVDLMDQCIAMYPHRRINKRWYIRVFFHFLDVTVVNAWHLYRMATQEKMDLLHFKASLARSLINAGYSQKRVRERPSTSPPPPLKRRALFKAPPEIRFAPGDHWPKLREAKNAKRCHDAACTRKTKYICMQCLCALCPGCFANFHTRNTK